MIHVLNHCTCSYKTLVSVKITSRVDPSVQIETDDIIHKKKQFISLPKNAFLNSLINDYLFFIFACLIQYLS